MKILEIISEAKAPGKAELDAAMKVIEAWSKAHPELEVTITTTAKKTLGLKVIGFFQLVGIAVPAIAFKEDMIRLDKMAQEKNANGEFKYSDKFISDTREMMWGRFAMAELTPVITMIATRIPLIRGLITLMLWAVGLGGAGFSGGVTLAVALAAQGAITALSVWLSTPAGAEWLEKNVFWGLLTQDVGHVLVTAWDFIYHKFFALVGKEEPEDPTHGRVDPYKEKQDHTLTDKEYADKKAKQQSYERGAIDKANF